MTLAFVTGGSRGLGLATALALNNQGIDLVLFAKDAERLSQTSNELNARSEVVDLENLENTSQVFDSALNKYGVPDILILAHGVMSDRMSKTLRTNLEAIAEIMIQLKLRKLSGLIVIDLIGMKDPYNSKLIENTAKRLSQHDKAKVQIHLIEEFSLLAISRQRISQSLSEAHGVKCTNCDGFGYTLVAIFNRISCHAFYNRRGTFSRVSVGARSRRTPSTYAR